MRRKANLSNPNHILRELEIEDFTKYTKYSKWMFATKNGLKPGCSTFDLAPCNYSNTRQLYSVRDKLYLYLTSGAFLEFVNGSTWKQLFTTTKRPTVISININGEYCSLILGSKSYVIHDDDRREIVDIPFGRGAVEYKRRLFVGDSNKIYFSKFLDSKDVFNQSSGYSYLATDQLDGDVTSFIPTKDYLIVFTTKTIYHLYVTDQEESFKLVRQNVNINLREGSVWQASGVTFFFTDNKLCKYENGKISIVDCFIKNKPYSFATQACVFGNAYMAIVYDDFGQSYLLYYDHVSGQEYFYKTTIVRLAENGYLVEDKRLKSYTEQSSPEVDGFWESIDFDFGSSKAKELKSIEIKTGCMTTVELETPCGTHVYSFDPGYTLIKPNVIDTKFKFIIKTIPLETDVQKIKLIYRIQEE